MISFSQKLILGLVASLGLVLFSQTAQAQPAAPAELYPYDGAMHADLTPEFTWESAPGASSYLFQLSLQSDFSSLLASYSGNQTRYQVAAGILGRGVLYYIRVQASNGSGASAWTNQSFRISQRTVEYRVRIWDANGTSGSSGGRDFENNVGTQRELVLPSVLELESQTTWNWTVSALDTAGNQRDATTWSFPLSDRYAPSLPEIVFPQDQSTIINQRPSFDWTDSVDPNGVVYTFQLATDSGFTNTLLNVPGGTQSNYSLTQSNQLTRGTTYYWRLVLTDSLNNSQTTPTYQFTVDAKTSDYRFELARNANVLPVDEMLRELGEGVTSYDPQPYEAVNENQTYYWQVVAIDPAGNERVTATSQFSLADNFPPSMPDLTYPEEGDIILNPQTSFDWSDSADSGGVNYRIQVALDSGFTNLVLNTPTTSSNYSLSSSQVLTRGQSYFWRVIVTDNSGNAQNSPGQAFTVDAKKPLYNIEVSDASNFGNSLINEDFLELEEYQTTAFQQLTPGTQYFWRVTARDESGNTRAAAANFTLQLADVFPPSESEPIYPPLNCAGGYACVLINPVVSFSWTAGQDVNGVTYRVQVAEDSGFNTMLIDQDNLTTPQYQSTAGQALARSGNVYYWRVLSRDSTGNQRTGATWSFQINEKTPRYDFEIASDALMTTVVADEDALVVTEHTLRADQELTEGRTYHWRVIASDLAGNTNASAATWTIQLADNYAPNLPEPVYPEFDGRSVTEIVNPNVGFLWTPSQDPNGVSYRIQISTDSAFGNLVIDQAGLTTNSFQPAANQALQRDTLFYWRIIVSDNLGNSANGPTWTFQVVPKTVEYTVQIAEDSGLTQIHYQADELTYTEFTLDASAQLTEGRSYFWRIDAVDPAGNIRTNASDFTMTLQDNYAPPTPEPVYPLANAELLNRTPGFDWTDVNDPNSVIYRFQLAVDEQFSNIVVDQDNLTVSSFQLATSVVLNRDGRYFWRVNTRDSLGNAQTGDAWLLDIAPKNVEYTLVVADNSLLASPTVSVNRLTNQEYIPNQTEQLTEGNTYTWRVTATDSAQNTVDATADFTFPLADLYAPSAALAVYPEDGSTVINDVVTFDWTDSTDSNGVTYALEVSANSLFSSPLVSQANLSASAYTLTTAQRLVRGQQYYWRVNVSDNQGNSALGTVFSFVVEDRNSMYTIEIAEDSGFATMHATGDSIPNPEYLLPQLNQITEGRDYYWRVTATDKATNTRVSSTFNFNAVDNYPPSFPEPVYPVDGALVLNPSLSFDWTDSVDPNGVSYRLQIASDSNFNALIHDISAGANSFASLTSAQALTRGQTYYWRVVVTDGLNNVGNGPAWALDLQARDVEYKVEVATDTGFTQMVVEEESLINSSFDLDLNRQLQEGVTYYWRIKANDLAENERVSSAAFTFGIDDVFAPSLPQRVYPLDETPLANDQVVFDWSDSIDSNGVSYGFQLSTDSGFVNVISSATGLTDSNHGPVTLPRGQLLYWRVNVSDTRGNSANGTTWEVQSTGRNVEYEIAIAEDSAFSQIHFSEMRLSPPEEYILANLNELDDGRPYWWKVTARDMAGNSLEAVAPFQLQLQDIYPPTIPEPVFPAHTLRAQTWSEETVINPQLTFDWTDSTDNNGVQYRIQVATDTTFVNRVVDQPVTTSHYALTAGQALTRDSRYYWRVIVSDNNNNTESGPTWIVDIDGKGENYTIEVARNSSFTTPDVEHSSIEQPEYLVQAYEELVDGAGYWWRVTALDSAGNTRSAAAVFQFNLADTYPPTLPEPVYPADGALVANDRAMFKWTPSTDSSGSVSYQIEVATDTSFSSIVYSSSNLTAPEWLGTTSQQLARGQLYYWRVTVTDGLNNSAQSPTWSLEVKSKAVEYNIQVAENIAFQPLVVDTIGLTVAEHTLPSYQALPDAATYFWRVHAEDEAGNQATSTANFRFDLADTYPPSQPELTYPTAGATVINPDIAFDWTDSTDSNGVAYGLEIATDSGFNNVLVSVPNLTASASSLPAGTQLVRGNTYFWRVTLADSLGNSDVSPAQEFTVSPRTVEYEIEVARDSGFTQAELANTGILVEEYVTQSYEALTEGQPYFWRVKSTDLAGNERVSNAAFTFLLNDRYPPTSPERVFPAGDLVINTRPTLDWTSSTDSNGVVYDLEVATGALFGLKVVDRRGLTNSHHALTSTETLNRDQLYFWRLTARDSLGNAVTTGAWALNVGGHDVRYRLQISDSSAFTTLTVDQDELVDPEHELTSLQTLASNTPYSWRVAAQDSAGNERVSNVFQFELQDNFAPSGAVAVYPTAGAEIANPAVDFDWTDAIDETSFTYALQVSTTENFASYHILAAGLTESNFVVTGTNTLSRGQQYYWRVRMTDSRNNIGYSASWPFSVAGKDVVYAAEIGRNPSFTNLDVSEQNITQEEFVIDPAFALQDSNTYHWRIRATDVAGNERLATSAFQFSLADTYAPSFPDLVYPTNGSTLANPVVGFDWSDSSDSNGVTYSLQIATDGAFTQLVANVQNLTSSEHALSSGQQLTRGQTYYWRVGVVDSLGNGALSPSQTFNITTKVERYVLEISEDTSFTNLHVSRTVTGTNTGNGVYELQPFEAVTEGRDYYWRVRGEDFAGNSVVSSNFTFRLADRYPPTAPVLVYPAHTSTLANPIVSFDWTDSSDLNGVAYELQLATAPDFSNVVVSQTLTTSQHALSSGLTRGQTYYWRLRVSDSLNNVSPWGNAQRFTIDAKASKYDLRVSRDSTFSSVDLEKIGHTQVEFLTPSYQGFLDGPTYYWKVAALDSAGNSSETSVFTFALTDMYAPPEPARLYPLPGAQMANAVVSFDWTDVSDTNGVTYGIEISDDSSFSNILVSQSGLTSSNFTTPAPLNRAGEYYWRLSTQDSRGNAQIWPTAQGFEVQPKVRSLLRVATDVNMTNVVYLQNQVPIAEHTTSSTAPFDVGRPYWWTVEQRDGAGHVVSQTGSPFRFVIMVPTLSTSNVTPRTQPERADYEFGMNRAVDWAVTLRLRESGQCTRIIHSSNVTAQANVTGTWAGLSPGAEYCWDVTGSDTTGMVQDSGTFSLPALPTFTTAPTYTRTGIEVDVAATASANGTAYTQYSPGLCSAIDTTSLRFAGNQIVLFPGEVIPRSAFAVEAWVKLGVANQSKDILIARGGNLRINLNNGNVRAQIVTDNGPVTVEASTPLPVGQYAHVVVSYGEHSSSYTGPRIYIDGVNRTAAAPFTGTLLEGTLNVLVGGFGGNGFNGDIASLGFYNRAIPTTEAQAHAALGSYAEIPQSAGRIAYYPLDESNHTASVQSVYDATGNHYAGVLGTNHLPEAFDGLRLPVFSQSVALAGGPSFAGRLTNMPGGPDYCGRVVVNTGSGWISSGPLDDFSRNTDLERPRVTVNTLNLVRECTGPNTPVSISVGPTANPPSSFDVTSTDDVSPFNLLQTGARLGSRGGQAITSWPHSFAVGDHSLYWYAIDEAGNTGWGDTVWWENNRVVGPQTVRVRDTGNPTATGGPVIVVEASSPSGTPVSPVPGSASDLCGAVTVTHTPAGPYALGNHRIEFRVEDVTGNVATATRTLTIQDTQAPFFNPAIGPYTVASPGGCFQYTPVTPPVEDLGYPAAQIVVTGERVSGAGLNQAGDCWQGGRHIYRWTLRDPAGNQQVVEQLINIVGATLNVGFVGLEVQGVSNPQPREFYNQDVGVVFTVTGGDSNYSLIVSPAPASLVGPNSSGEYRATYSAEGPYPNVLIRAQDGGGVGANYGAALLDGFGIDKTAPVIDVDNGNCVGCAFTYLDQSAVNLAETHTYPNLYFGESILLQRIFASDGAYNLRNVGNGLRFTGGQHVRDPSNASWPSVSGTNTGLSVAMWVNAETLQYATLFQIPDANRTIALTMTDRGRLCWGYGHRALASNETIFDSRSCSRNFARAADTQDGVIRPGEWQYVVATWDFDRGVWNIYVDGRAAGHRSGVGVRGNSWDVGGGMNARAVIGAHTNYGVSPAMGNYFTGQIAQVHIGMTPMTMNEIIPAYRGGVGDDIQAQSSTWGLYKFVGNTLAANGLQDIEDSSAATYGRNTMVLGASSAISSDDPGRVSLADPYDSNPGGLRNVNVEVIDVSQGLTQLVSVTSTIPSGSKLNRGRRWMGGVGCTVTSACTRGDPGLSVSALRFWNMNQIKGRFKLRIKATDVAGNEAIRELGFKTDDFSGALNAAIDTATRVSQSPSGIGVTELEDAIIDFQVARSYWSMSDPYPEGSYLRTARGMGYLDDAEQVGVDTGTISINLARAMQGQVGEYLDSSIGVQVDPNNQALRANGDNYIRMAEFYKTHAESDALQQVALSRTGLDAVALLYPRYQDMKLAASTARNDWETFLGNYASGQINVEYLRSGPRTVRVRGMMAQTADMLRDSMYRELDSILSNPFTSQRQALEEMKDVLDKSSSTDANEAGDLLNITVATVNNACLDVLARTFTLPDDDFTRCYIRLNDLARFLDSVSEPLVHTYRFRAGLALVLFNLLDTSLYLSPTGLNWMSGPSAYTVPGTEQLVLPDVEAANVPGSIPISVVDLQDGALARAYERYQAARDYLEAGEVDQAWAIFVQERCLLLTTYNRYYSTNRMLSTVADPKEMPITPSTVGCP